MSEAKIRRICFSTVVALSVACLAQNAPPEEDLRKWWTFQPGTEVVLLKPDHTRNWTPQMNSFAGSKAVITELLFKDYEGYYCVRVDVDKGNYAWRVRNLANPKSSEAGALAPLCVMGTDIPLCVVPKHANVPLYTSINPGEIVGKVPSLETLDSDGRRWILPKYLYIHAETNEFYEVMQSDLSSRKTLGWIRRSDVYPWITRQGYIINYARPEEHRKLLVRGFATKEDIGVPGKEMFAEDIARRRNTDPNLIGMPDGLLIGKDAEPYRGMDVVQSAMWNHVNETYEQQYLPVRHTLTPATDTIIPVALMSETDIQELEAAAHLLYGACDRGGGRIDEIREALEKNWDLTGKVVIGVERRNQQLARGYLKVQRLFPTLTAGLKLPPGDAPDATFKQLGQRAERIAANAGRILADMRRDKRSWVWVSLAELY